MQLTITRQLLHLEKNVLAKTNKGQQAPKNELSVAQNNFSIKIRQKQQLGKKTQPLKSRTTNN